ncbi:MAG: TraB/GumN family protein [Pseudomonadota bacterium]
MTKTLSRLWPPAALFAALFAASCVHQPAAVAPQTPAPLAAAAVVAAPAAPAPAQAPTATDADPALWVVKDADTTIYLFGTIHVLKPGLSWFDEGVKTAFDASDELRLELVFPAAAEAQAIALKAGTSTGTVTLPDRLSPAARAKYLATLSEFGLPATALDRFQPWFAANNLTVLPLLKLGYALDSGAEQVLTRAAKDAGKPVSGFETMTEQLGFFASLSERAQIAYLSSVLDELPKVGTTVETMVGEWGKGDPAALAKLLNDGLDDNRELATVLLNDRNARWAGWIANRLATPGTVFVAVGAGHLAGADSVQAKLAAKGLTATRVLY